MAAQILDGKQLSAQIQAELGERIKQGLLKGYACPYLSVILVGEDFASSIYVQHKRLACQNIGIHSEVLRLNESVTQSVLLAHIQDCNRRPEIHGILVQLPLPAHIDTRAIIDAISPHKDVDGFHPLNMGLLAQKRPYLRPCTPAGIMQLLAAYNLALSGLKACVIGSSNIVGRPMIFELLSAKATVTACHSKTVDLQAEVEQAELLVVAVGQAHLIKGTWIRPGAIVIDVGMSRHNGRLVGDVDYEAACARAAWISPVPGGVGPMTVASLLQNTLLAAWGK